MLFRVSLPGGAISYPAQLSVSTSFDYSQENLLIPTIKATIETSWYHIDSTPVGYPAFSIIANIYFLGIKRKKGKGPTNLVKYS
jgi:hypothetical protein